MLYYQHERSTTLHTKWTNGGKRRIPDETIQKVFLRCEICVFSHAFCLESFGFSVFWMFLLSLEFIDDDPHGAWNEMEWYETNGMDMGWKPALRSESFFMPFWQYAYRTDAFLCTCINELYEHFSTLTTPFLTCLCDHSLIPLMHDKTRIVVSKCFILER